jgi:long-chain acyl-CoA synthetase
MTLDEASRLRLLTTPGGAFPLIDIDVDGVRLQMFDREPRTLREAFLATDAFRERVAVVYEDQRWTYGEQWETVVTLAHVMRDRLGIAKGEHVGIAMRNYPEFAFAFWAAELLGAVVVPFNGWLRTAELSDLVDRTAPKVLFADTERIALLADSDLAAKGVETVVAVRCEVPTGRTPNCPVVGLQALLDEAERRSDPPAADVRPEDRATIVFTSGTTAQPKGAEHTHRNHCASLLNKLIRAVGVEQGTPDGPVEVRPPAPSVKLVTFPFFHIAGLNTLYTAAYSGHTIVLMYKWDAHKAVDLVEREHVSELAGPPFVVQTFLAASTGGERDLGSLRIMGMGGASTPVRVIAEIADRFGSQVTPRTGYGLTETTSGVIAISAADFARHPSSVGRPLPTAEVAILAEDGEVLGTGGEGEIAIRGPQVARGYYGVRDAPEFRDGWFRTGDLGRIDDEGLIYIVGRLKDVVIRGGENINCAEVEAALTAHADVVEAAALGTPHDTLGEELVAVVRLRPGSTIDVQEMRAFVADRVAAFKVPERITITDEPLPRTQTGKLLKRDITQQLKDQSRLRARTGS